MQSEKQEKQLVITDRHRALYDLLVSRTLSGEKTTCKDICDALPGYYTLNEKQSHHSNCPHIYQDALDITLSEEFKKVIIADNNDFRIAKNEAEAMAYARKLVGRAVHRFKRYWAIKGKCEKNGQGELNLEGDELAAMRFIETFLKPDSKKEEEAQS